MIFTDISIFERIGRRRANVASAIALGLMLLIFLFKLPFILELPKDEELSSGGAIVAMGWPDFGSKNDTPSAGGGQPTPPVESKVTPISPSPSRSTPSTGVITNEDSEVNYTAEAKKKEENKRKLKEIEEATKARRDAVAAETENKRRADEIEAQRKADAYNKKKSGFNEIFKKSGAGVKGASSGNNQESINGGVLNGEPNSKNLDGVVGIDDKSGPGRVIGGDIGNRKVLSNLPPSNKYNEAGVVIVSVCVIADGSIEEASIRVINKGTTTASSILRAIATENARTYRFNAGEYKQCGSITYRFRIK